MSILKKIMTAFRGGAREIGESIVDANSTRIFEQEIKDAQAYLEKAKHDLTDVMAKKSQAGRKLEDVKRRVAEHEGYAEQALAKNDEALALEVAEKISEYEQELHEQKEIFDSFSGHVTRLKDLVRKTERQIQDYNRQLAMVKTTESVQKASSAITDNFASTNSRVLGAKASLDRIKQRQQDQFDRMKAAEELQAESSDKGLRDRLKDAGIGGDSSAQSVLERLKAKQAKS